jgi:hypothetical protein
MNKEQPKIKFCPFCGGEEIKFVLGVPRCKKCLAIFHLYFSRYARKSPKSSNVKLTGGLTAESEKTNE